MPCGGLPAGGLREALAAVGRDPPGGSGSGTRVALAYIGASAAAVAMLGIGSLARRLWAQYGPLLSQRGSLPEHDLGLPLVGHSMGFLRESLNAWIARRMRGRQAFLTNFLGSNVTVVAYDTYMKYMHSADVNGQLRPSRSLATIHLTGRRSVFNLPGGKGHDVHKRLRTKILRSFGPAFMLACVPRLEVLIRSILDRAMEDTEEFGSVSFEPLAAEMAARATILQITAGVDTETQERLLELLDDIAPGLLSYPIDLGRFTVFGRAMAAKRELRGLITELMQNPNLSEQNLVSDLMQDSAEGKGFTVDEIMDTVLTIFVGGKTTTADLFPALLVQLHRHPEWAAKVAEEPIAFQQSVEEDSVTLRVVREAFRVKPPINIFRREALDPSVSISLGPHGSVPPGCSVAIDMGSKLLDMGADFDPDRWTKDGVRDRFVGFGGSQPHGCIGKALALAEMQVFARLLCSEYDFEVVSDELWVNPQNPVGLSYKDGLQVKVWHKFIRRRLSTAGDVRRKSSISVGFFI